MKTLKEIPHENPFRVPENYFEEVNRRILAATVEKEKKVLKISLYQRFRPYILAAASVALFAVLSYTAAKIFIPGTGEPKIPELSREQFSSAFFNDNDIDITTLENSTDPETLPDEVPEIGKHEIIDYLILENVNINDIYELYNSEI